MKIYGIDITADDIFTDYADTIEDIEDEDLMDMAEKQGYVWSLDGFINALNRDEINTDFFWFRAIDSKENA
jgi:hypothetical protein